jgi:hypothetical protein
MAEPNILEEMAAILEGAAALVLGDIRANVVQELGQSVAELEAIEMQQEIGSDLPRDWIRELTSTYLNQVAHELVAIAMLLKNEVVVGSIEVLVRATLERIGRINWVLDLDHHVSTRRRAIRASFEILVSYQHYRIGLSAIGAENASQRRVAREMRDLRNQVETWFDDIYKPPENPSDPASAETPTISEWTIEGEPYPNYSELARWAISDDSVGDNTSRGTYALLSAFGHPSFVAHRELLLEVDGATVYYYAQDYLDRLIRLSLFGFADSLKRWSSYFDISHNALVGQLDQLNARWEALELPGGDSN